MRQVWSRAHRMSVDNDACRLLMIGEDNPQSVRDEHALFPYPPGCAGQRLAEILGLSTSEHLAVWRTNLCCPTWSKRQARSRRDDLLAPDVPWDVLFILGRKVAGIFEEVVGQDMPAFSSGSFLGPTSDGRGLTWGRSASTSADTAQPRQFKFLVLPHPSGRNLVWNNRENWRLARQLADTVVNQHPHRDVPFGSPQEVL